MTAIQIERPADRCVGDTIVYRPPSVPTVFLFAFPTDRKRAFDLTTLARRAGPNNGNGRRKETVAHDFKCRAAYAETPDGRGLATFNSCCYIRACAIRIASRVRVQRTSLACVFTWRVVTISLLVASRMYSEKRFVPPHVRMTDARDDRRPAATGLREIRPPVLRRYDRRLLRPCFGKVSHCDPPLGAVDGAFTITTPLNCTIPVRVQGGLPPVQNANVPFARLNRTGVCYRIVDVFGRTRRGTIGFANTPLCCKLCVCVYQCRP